MNILIVTPYPPVLHVHGGGVRMFHNIRILAEKHSVRVLSFVENEEELEWLKSVQPICESITGIRRTPDFGAHWFSLAPFMVREFGTPAMHQAVDEAIRMKKVDVAGVPVLLARHEGIIEAIVERCSHLGGPLSEGTLEDNSVRCPWHGSRFCLETGKVLDGPATFDQPCFDTRITNGQIEIKARDGE